jgi:hypothetical protein
VNNGVVATLESPAVSYQGGALEHLNSPTTIDKVAYSGYKTGFSNQSQGFGGLFNVAGTGLIDLSFSFGNEYIVSADQGQTFTESEKSADTTMNIDGVWISKDASGKWHLVDHVGNVWVSPTAPGTTATWTRTWQPGGDDPVPKDPQTGKVPAADCQDAIGTGYYVEAQQLFWASSDGAKMLYGYGFGDYPAGVCRSTDGGNNFLPVAFPNPPAPSAMKSPYVILFTSDTHGIAAYANELDDAGSSYVYITDDAGATWTAGALPASLASTKYALGSGFASRDGKALFLGGRTGSPSVAAVLLKSTDGGKTWKDISGNLNAAANGSFYEVHAGFALDANNVWVGGDKGGLFYSKSAGE